MYRQSIAQSRSLPYRPPTRFLINAVVLVVLTLLLAIVGVQSAFASSGGPPDGRSNAPGEGNCTGCHNTFPLNSGAGTLAIGGFDGTYSPGQQYQIEVQLADPDAQRWGFQFTVLDGSDNSVGTLMSVDGTTQTSTGGPFGRTYAEHTSAGTFPGTPGSASWLVDWTAPAAGTGDVTIYVAGNAANGNFNNSGDRIYASTLALIEDDDTAVDSKPLLALLLENFPNPFNPSTTIHFELAAEQRARLSVYRLDGRRVSVLVDGIVSAGNHEISWDGRDDNGASLPSGTYLYRLETATMSKTRSMTLIK